jgi:alkylation response protein AidB-like acyl-CoA dehydrogenase
MNGLESPGFIRWEDVKEYPIARLYTDARVARIYAATSEVMKVIIAKSLGL